jgi:hypothetical protein
MGREYMETTHESNGSELMRFKRTLTDPVPEEREKTFAKAGTGTFHSVADHKRTVLDRRDAGRADLQFMSFVGNCKFNHFATQMTTHEDP